jgi:RecB family exonuclease
MPLNVVRAAHNAELWDRCVDEFLEDAAGSGPAGHRPWIWLSHRNLRDRLFEAARARGHDGWLEPPISFFGDLADLFDLRGSPVGLLTRRRILSRQASRLGREIFGRADGQGGGVIRSHILDAMLADLLPEGVSPDELRDALAQAHADDDEFTRARDRWVVEVYAAYLDELRRLGKSDWRSINALLAGRIEAGGLPVALRGAERLHIYGITSPRARRRLLRALAGQSEVDVHLYLLDEPEEERPLFADFADFMADDAVAAPSAVAGARPAAEPTQLDVQPAPDAAREMAWVAREIKQLITGGGIEPHEIAVVARSGREDTRRAYGALRAAGVPATARIRTPLAEITALQALLLVFRGAARDWDYRSLRAVLDHPYFDTKVDLRGLDFIAGARRVVGLGAWRKMLEEALRLVRDDARETWGQGLFADRLERDVEAFDAVRQQLEPLSVPRPEAEWIGLTRSLLKDGRGLFFLRRRLCDPVNDRWDIVRTDQRGVIQLERLLAEWQQLDLGDEPLDPAGWYALLRQLLEGNELVLSTPGQKGVQVLEAHDAGLVPFAHTFVVHANDGEFPRLTGAAGVLSDEERARLDELGIPVDHREASLRRERSLWRAVTRKAAPVRVSYRTTNPSGTPLLPSLMVPEHDPARELPRLRRPAGGAPVSPADADQLAAFTLAERLASEPAGPAARPTAGPHAAGPADRPRIRVAPSHPERLRQAIVAAVAESHRGPGLDRAADLVGHPALRPNPWNGELRDPEVLDWLERKFDADYTWSASQLEAYARSPFQFMLERVLRLTGREEAEEETSALTFGGVAHEILERFYREHLDPLPGGLTGAAAERFEEIARGVCEAREARGEWLGLPALWETSRENIVDAVRAYVEWELGHLRDKGEVPVLVEHQFGYDPDALVLEGRDVAGRPSRLRLRGKIDRVDRTGSPDDPVLHVLDFKSGSTPGKNDYEDGTVLQGALYLEVLAAQGHRVKHGRYRSIRNPGKPQNGGLIEHGSGLYDDALELAFSIPVRVRAGRFEAVASRKGGWKDWDVALEIRRSAAEIQEGHRFAERADE